MVVVNGEQVFGGGIAIVSVKIESRWSANAVAAWLTCLQNGFGIKWRKMNATRRWKFKKATRIQLKKWKPVSTKAKY